MNVLAAKMKYIAACLSVPAMLPGGQLRLGQAAGSGCAPLQGAGQMGPGTGAVCVFRGSAAASQSWSTHAPKKWKPPEVGITACPVPSPADGKPLSRGDPSLLLDLSGQAPT